MKKPGFLFLGLVLAASLQSLSAQNSENEPCSTPTWLGVRDITYDSAGFVAWEPVHKILRLIAAEDTTTYDWGTATSFAVSGLLPETEYIAEIRAVCAPGDSSDWGATTTFTTEKAPCPTPTWLGVRDITYDSAGFVTFSPESKILRLIAAEDTTTYDWGTATSFAVSGLLPETEYIAEIRAVCAPGDSSDWGATTTFTTEKAPCPTPTWLGVRDITYDSAGFVTFSPESKILRLIAAEDTTTYDWGTATSFAVSGLLPETEYIAEIRAVCAPGDSSDWGATTTFTTEKAPCPTPTWLGVRDITYDSAGFVTFSPESKILRLIAAEDTTTYDWGTATSFAVSGLLPETEYIAEIRAVCAPGDSSDWGAATTFTTEKAPVAPICGIPSQLESQCDSLSAELQWIPGENNIAFNLIYKLEENQTYDTLSTVDSYTALMGLAPGSYRWTVRGLCNNDTSDFAEEVGFDIEQLANQTRQTFGLNCFMQEGRLHILNPGNILIKRVQIFNSIGQCLSTMETQTSLDMQIEFPIQHQVLLVLVLTDRGRVAFKIYAR